MWVALFVLALTAYANCFQLGVALDGHANLADPRIHAATTENLRLIFTKDYWWPEPQDRLYRPVTKLSFLFNYAVLGNQSNPDGYHALNVALHMANVGLVFALALQLFGIPWPAFFAACLWAVHPAGPDAVANLAGRADLLAALGVLGALLIYARIGAGRARPLTGALAIFALAALSVCSKENGGVLAGLMLLWDLVHGFGGRAGLRRRIPAYAGAAAALLLFLVLRTHAYQGLPMPVLAIFDNPLLAAGFWEARWTAVKIVGMDLWLLVFPVRLAADRSFNEIPLAGAADPAAWASLLLVTAILGAVIARRRREPLLFWAAGLFGIALLPVSNLVVLIGAPMAERFLYLPSVGFAIAVAALAYRFARPRTAALFLGAAIVLFAARTLARNPDWDNDLALTRHDVAAAPRSSRLHAMYGEFLFQTGSTANIDRAIAEEETAWALLAPLPPAVSYAVIPSSLGRLYGIKGDMAGPATPQGAMWHAKALAMAERAVAIATATQQRFDDVQLRAGKPLPRRLSYQNVFAFTAIGYRTAGRYAEAIGSYRRALAIAPANPEYYAGIADSYTSMGDFGAAAVTILEKGLAFGLTPAVMAEMGRAYEKAPGGACAIGNQAGLPALDTDCPRVRADLCRALHNLAKTYTDAREEQRAAEFQGRAAQLGCAAER
jgi:tetratricopeptide (TPR) repeat protein